MSKFSDELPLHLLPFARASYFGPLLLCRFFDSAGRKPMIVASITSKLDIHPNR